MSHGRIQYLDPASSQYTPGRWKRDRADTAAAALSALCPAMHDSDVEFPRVFCLNCFLADSQCNGRLPVCGKCLRGNDSIYCDVCLRVPFALHQMIGCKFCSISDLSQLELCKHMLARHSVQDESWKVAWTGKDSESITELMHGNWFDQVRFDSPLSAAVELFKHLQRIALSLDVGTRAPVFDISKLQQLIHLDVRAPRDITAISSEQQHDESALREPSWFLIEHSRWSQGLEWQDTGGEPLIESASAHVPLHHLAVNAIAEYRAFQSRDHLKMSRGYALEGGIENLKDIFVESESAPTRSRKVFDPFRHDPRTSDNLGRVGHQMSLIKAPQTDGADGVEVKGKRRTHLQKPFYCLYPGCAKTTKGGSDLEKHMQWHEKLFGCTFDGCYKSYGSKDDWRRHEKLAHEQQERWLCECRRVFHKISAFDNHMRRVHKASDTECQDLAQENRIGRNHLGRFWCGFCDEVIMSSESEIEANNHRIHHIAEHFIKDQKKIEDWVELSGGGKTKAQVQSLKISKGKKKSTVKTSGDGKSSMTQVQLYPEMEANDEDQASVVGIGHLFELELLAFLKEQEICRDKTSPRLLPQDILQLFRWMLRACDFSNPGWRKFGADVSEKKDRSHFKMKTDHPGDTNPLKDEFEPKYPAEKLDRLFEMMKAESEESSPHKDASEELSLPFSLVDTMDTDIRQVIDPIESRRAPHEEIYQHLTPVEREMREILGKYWTSMSSERRSKVQRHGPAPVWPTEQDAHHNPSDGQPGTDLERKDQPLERRLPLDHRARIPWSSPSANASDRPCRISSSGSNIRARFKREPGEDEPIEMVPEHLSVRKHSTRLDRSPIETDDSYMESSGEESFILDDDDSPTWDEETRAQVESVVSELGQEIAAEFLSMSALPTTCTQKPAQESSGSSGTDQWTQVGAGSSTAPTSLTKRSYSENRPCDEDEQDDARERKRRRHEKPCTNDLGSDSLLACPYAKRDPARYSEANQNLSEKAYRRCRTACLTSIGRLKQHLYRVHCRPAHYCSSCYMEFATEIEVEEHSRARLCALTDCPFKEKMTSDQFKAVKRRRIGESPVNVWYSIFEILFPGAERPENVCVEHANVQVAVQSVQDYTTFLENRLPLRLSERLGGPLFNADPEMYQWLINMALEATLPTVLQELGAEYETLNPENEAEDDSG